MPIPDRRTIKKSLIDYIAMHGGPGGSLRPADIYDGLATQLGLTREDRALQRQADSLWENEVRGARQELVEQGYILPVDQAQWGIWKLTRTASHYNSESEINSASTSQQVPYEFSEIHSDLSDEGVFSPVDLSDARDIIVRAIVQRRGQNEFRAKLLLAYEFCCCVTEEKLTQVLEAAHIVPYRGEKTNHVQNGLLLRSDIHTLFDLHLLSIRPEDYTVVISPNLTSSSYAILAGARIRLAKAEEHRPSRDALKIHRDSCNF